MTGDLSRLSLNQATLPAWDVPHAVEGCARAGIGWIGLWRDRVAEAGLARAAALVHDAGIRVSSLCRGGWFLEGEPDRRREDNLRAIEEAHQLGAGCLVLVCGPAADRDLPGARRAVEEAVAELEPYARAAGVRLAVEPLHPMFCGDRSLVVTLEQARALACRTGDSAGVVVDAYHVWWDPDLQSSIGRATGRILGLHVSDWLVPPPDFLNGRGLMGDGVIDLVEIRRQVDATGYRGPIEVEIFNGELFARDPDQALREIARRYLDHVLEPVEASA